MPNTHGLASDIRSASENETFDLGGLAAATIETTFRAAFSEPLDAASACPNGSDLIRLTFLVGAGKQARQKYDVDAPKSVASSLQACGYEQDKAASGVLECAGTFKSQHDTAKNLKTIVVYPKVTGIPEAEDSGGTPSAAAASAMGSPDDPRYKMCVASTPVFETMLVSKCPTWTQKKRALSALDKVKEDLDECERTLLSGAPLGDARQTLYDAVVELPEKRTWLQTQLQAHITEGKLTKDERDKLLKQNAEKIESLRADGKKVPPALLSRKEKLSAITGTVQKKPLKHQAAINKLRKELKPLEDMEKSASKGGKLLSLKETKQLARKDEILEEIAKLTIASKGWFDDDDDSA